MQKRNIIFYRGDIVDFILQEGHVQENIHNMRQQISLQDPYKLIVMKHIDDNFSLVAICKRSSSKPQVKIQTNRCTLYVKIDPFYVIDNDSLQPCKDVFFKGDKSSVISEIYDSHNKHIEFLRNLYLEEHERILRRNAKRRTTKLQQRKKQRTSEERYRKEYELAAINNDKKLMQDIVDTLGYVPTRRGMSSHSKTKGLPYKEINPKTFNGGGFSPR